MKNAFLLSFILKSRDWNCNDRCEDGTYTMLVSAGNSGISFNCWRTHRTVLCWQEHLSGHPIALTVREMLHNAISAMKIFLFTSFIFLLDYWLLNDIARYPQVHNTFLSLCLSLTHFFSLSFCLPVGDNFL